MKNLIKFFMVMAVLCMTACSQTFEDVSNNAKPQEKGRLVMNVGSRSRTIMPTVDTLKSNIKSATLTAMSTKGQSWSRKWSGDNVIGQIESDNSILLDVGTYNFEMKFCNGTNDVILSGTIDNQEIKTGDNSLTFDMQISTTGKGNISITLSREADSGINKIKAGLYNIATGEAVENYGMKELTISSDTYTTCYSKDDVPAGQYIIKFEVYDTSDKLLNTLTDVIEVIGGITTTHQITLNKINTQYTITYNLDEGKWQNGFTPITKRNANTKVTLPTADNIEKENFILAGWYDGKGNIITEIPSDTIEDITVTAVWGTIKGTDTVEWNTTANTVAAVIKTLPEDYTHDIVVTGAITNDTISAINTALKNNSSAKVNLDLSGTTGSNELPSYAFQDCKNLTSVTIPAGVTSIGMNAFYNCSSLTSVTIPDSVTTIGGGAFYNCSRLESVTIPNSVKSIDYNAFYGCTGLTSVTIPDSVTSIASGAFKNCKNLTSVTIPDSVTSIDGGAFSGCSSLESVTIPAGVTYIDGGAFKGCSSLESVTIPAGVTSIGDTTFQDCKNLTSVTIPAGVTYIDMNAFYNCSSLTSVTIPDSVTSIGYQAFYGCSSLESVTIPNSVKSIGMNAFYNCSSLTSVTIPDSVTSISSSAFQDCKNLTSVTIPNSVKSIGMNAFDGCSSLTSVTIPDSVTSISSSAFYNCSRLTTVNYKGTEEQWGKITGIGQFGNVTINYNHKVITVTAGDMSTEMISNLTEGGSYTIIVTGEISDTTISAIEDALESKSTAKVNLDLSGTTGLISIGDGAFYDCSSLTSVTIGDNVTSIGVSAFQNCGSLTSVTIPDSVTSIGSSAFNGCTGLTSVIIGDGVKKIGDSAFCNCSSLTRFIVSTNNANFSTSDDGKILYNKDKTALIAYPSATGDVTIPDSVKSIGEQAFANCTGLTSVTIPDGVTSIGYATFAGCSKLTSVTIPDGVTSIGEQAFYGCDNLTTVNYKGTEEQWGQISKNSGNEALTNATINYYSFKVTANDVSSKISGLGEGSYTIIVTEEISDATISAINTALSGSNAKVNLDLSHIENLTELPDEAFKNCGSLTSVTIGNSVTYIDSYAFYGCTGLTSVTIPNSVKSIDYNAFYGCSSLTSVTIPAGVTYIGSEAFRDCSSLESVTIPNSMTSIGGAVFKDCSSLTSVTIPDSVTTIADWAFNGCSSLTTVNYKGTQEQWEQISKNSGNEALTNATINYNYTGE